MDWRAFAIESVRVLSLETLRSAARSLQQDKSCEKEAVPETCPDLGSVVNLVVGSLSDKHTSQISECEARNTVVLERLSSFNCTCSSGEAPPPTAPLLLVIAVPSFLLGLILGLFLCWCRCDSCRTRRRKQSTWGLVDRPSRVDIFEDSESDDEFLGRARSRASQIRE